MKSHTSLLFVAFSGTMATAAPRVSSSYSIPAEVIDAGGRRTTSASYEACGSFHDATGIGTAGAPGNYNVFHGFLSQTSGGGLPSAFVAWQTAKFGNASLPQAAPLADPDNDGLVNVSEFAFDLDPTMPNLTSLPPTPPGSRGIPVFRFTAGALPHLEIDYIRRTDGSVEYLVESSSNLLTWTPTLTFGGPPPVAAGAGHERVTFVEFNAPPAPGRIFHRLAVRLVSP